MKGALRVRGGAAAWANHLPWVMLGIQASPKEESGTSAGEAALGHVLAVLGQLLTTTAPPADTPAPPAVVPEAKRTYAEAAATPALPLPLTSTCSAAPFLVLEKGPKVFKLQLGTQQEVVSRDRLALAERRVEDLPQVLRKTVGSSVTDTRHLC